MFNEQKYQKELETIHEHITMPLDSQTKEAYDLFCKFMSLYDNEKNLQHWAFRKCFNEGREDDERTLDDLQ